MSLGSLAILILIPLIFALICSLGQSTNWTSLPKKTQPVMATVATTEAYFVQFMDISSRVGDVRLAWDQEAQSPDPKSAWCVH